MCHSAMCIVPCVLNCGEDPNTNPSGIAALSNEVRAANKPGDQSGAYVIVNTAVCDADQCDGGT